jgi:enhancing lycopene biosynthesis protein 2
VIDLAEVKGSEYDAFVLPGGFGAAKNLSTFAFDGADCSVDPQVDRVLREAHQAGKPIGLACIAPVIAAKLFGQELHPKLTIGHDKETAAKIEAMGAQHDPRQVDDISVDADHLIVTTPCYMAGTRVAEIFTGAQKLIDKVLELAKHR